MKLGSLRTSDPDGELIVCSQDLMRAVSARKIAPSLAQALHRWQDVSGALRTLSDALALGAVPTEMPLDLTQLTAPLPRPASWIDSSVYLNHMERARKLRGVEMPEIFRTEPLLTPRVAMFAGSHSPQRLPDDDVGLDIEGEIAVILDDVPAGTATSEAGSHIALLTLINDTSLRTLLARELKVGKGSYHGKGVPAMAPVAVTPDELGDAWDGRKVMLPLCCLINDRLLGCPNAGVDMHIKFPEIIADAVRLRPLPAGTVLGAGTVSNSDSGVGFACIAEARMVETIEHGAPQTSYLRRGDRIRIEMFGDDGRTIFGPIAQTVY